LKILSIDTSSPICTVAILEDNKLINEISLNNGLTHSETLMPIIEQILKEANLKIKDIDLLVCDKGPGSFTGIRIGIATVKAFTDSLNIPAIGISSLETLAYNIDNNGIICSLIDAKNDNCYYGIFENKNGEISLIDALSVDEISIILDNLKDIKLPITFVGDGALVYKENILQILPESHFTTNNNLSAYKLGLAGLNHFKNNTIDEVLPLYLRAPKAEQLLEAKKNG